MRRKLWTAVLVTVVLMVAAGNLPDRLPSSGLVAAGSALWDALVARLPALTRALLTWALETPAAALGASAILTAMAGALFTLALAGRRRDLFGTVVREVRGGRHIACVARRTRLAQDAVRTLLRPGRVARRRSRRRRESPSAPEGMTPSRDRRRSPASDGMRWVESS